MRRMFAAFPAVGSVGGGMIRRVPMRQLVVGGAVLSCVRLSTSAGGVDRRTVTTFAKEVLTKGDESKPAVKGKTAVVHYVGTLLDGTKFDSSRDRGRPFEFQLGAGQVIKGWDQGVATMTVGEKAVLTVGPDYGYGARGIGPIPPSMKLSSSSSRAHFNLTTNCFTDSVLVFEVELLAMK